MEEKVRNELQRLLRQHVPPLTTQQVETLIKGIDKIYALEHKNVKNLGRSRKKTEKRAPRNK